MGLTRKSSSDQQAWQLSSNRLMLATSSREAGPIIEPGQAHLITCCAEVVGSQQTTELNSLSDLLADMVTATDC